MKELWKTDQFGKILAFHAKKSKGLTIALCIIGSLLIFAGCMTIQGDPLDLVGLKIIQSEVRGLILLGLISVIVGLVVPWSFHRYKPDSISFDSNLGAVEIRNRQSRFLLPFSEIEKVDVRTIRHTSSKGGTSYEYMLYFSKKDGSVWDLVSGGVKETMEKRLAAFLEKVDLTSSHKDLAQPQLPRGFTETDTGISWLNRPGMKDFASYIVFILVGGIFLLFGTAVFSNWKPGFIPLCAVMGCFFLVYLYLTAMVIRKAVRKIATSHSLAIRAEGIEYSETRGRAAKTTLRRIPTEDLDAVSFHHKPLRLKFVITILSKKDSALYAEDQMEDILLGDFSLKKSPYANSITLDIDALDAVEKLRLEDYIQRRVKAVSGATLK